MNIYALSATVLLAGCGGKHTCLELRNCPAVDATISTDADASSVADSGTQADTAQVDAGHESSVDAGSDAADAAGEDTFVEASIDAPLDHSTADAPPDRTPDVEAGPPLSCGGLNVGPKPTTARSMDTPPLPMGGPITDGRYVLKDVVFYEDQFSYSRATLDIRNNWFHRLYSVYNLSDDPLSGYEEIGTYATTGGAMALDVWLCGSTTKVPYLWRFTATPTAIKIFTDAQQGGIGTVQTYELVDGG